MKTLKVEAFHEEFQIELELQAEAAGMSVEDYAAQLLHDALQRMLKRDTDDGQSPVVH